MDIDVDFCLRQEGMGVAKRGSRFKSEEGQILFHKNEDEVGGSVGCIGHG